jgi:hypothetical protein
MVNSYYVLGKVALAKLHRQIADFQPSAADVDLHAEVLQTVSNPGIWNASPNANIFSALTFANTLRGFF